MSAAAVEVSEMRSPARAQATDAPTRLRRLGGFLRWLTAGLLVGTIVELLLLGHYKDPIQLVPFALCLLGLGALGLVSRRSDRLAVLAFRATMVALALGSLIGAVEHAVGNLGFVLETQPNASLGTQMVAVLTGRDPLLAPGVLVVTAALALASAYAVGGQPRDGDVTGEGLAEGISRDVPIGRKR